MQYHEHLAVAIDRLTAPVNPAPKIPDWRLCEQATFEASFQLELYGTAFNATLGYECSDDDFEMADALWLTPALPGWQGEAFPVLTSEISGALFDLLEAKCQRDYLAGDAP